MCAPFKEESNAVEGKALDHSRGGTYYRCGWSRVVLRERQPLGGKAIQVSHDAHHAYVRSFIGSGVPPKWFHLRRRK